MPEYDTSLLTILTKLFPKKIRSHKISNHPFLLLTIYIATVVHLSTIHQIQRCLWIKIKACPLNHLAAVLAWQAAVMLPAGGPEAWPPRIARHSWSHPGHGSTGTPHCPALRWWSGRGPHSPAHTCTEEAMRDTCKHSWWHQQEGAWQSGLTFYQQWNLRAFGSKLISFQREAIPKNLLLKCYLSKRIGHIKYVSIIWKREHLTISDNGAFFGLVDLFFFIKFLYTCTCMLLSETGLLLESSC